MGTVLKRTQCPKCQDSGEDNLVHYSDGGAKCFACGYQNKENEKESIQKMFKNTSNIDLIYNTSTQEILSRCISKDTCEKIGIHIVKFTGYLNKVQVRDKYVVVFNHYDNTGNLIKQKIRDIKDRSLTTQRGDTQSELMCGQHAFKPNKNRFIIITEGEFDAAAIYEATGYPAVSITKGAQGAKKQLQANLEWLSGWKQVILCFDNDEAGQQAVNNCIPLFEPGELRIAKLPLKDANEMLIQGRGSELKDYLWNAQEYKPQQIVQISDILPRVLDRPVMGISYPWKELNEITYGFRTKQIICVAAGTGIGKTEVIKDIILHLCFKEDIVVGLASCEQSVEDTARRIIGGILNIPLHIPGEWWNEEQIVESSKLFQDKLFLYDQDGAFKLEDLISFIKYLAKAKNVKLIVIDHLKALAATMKDKLTGVEEAMAELKGLCNQLDISIVLVCHLSKDKKSAKVGQEDESWRNGRRPVLENIYGSSAVEAWSDIVLGLSRNANSEDPELQCILNVQCLKSRLEGTQSGRLFHLTYDAEHGKLKEIDFNDKVI